MGLQIDFELISSVSGSQVVTFDSRMPLGAT